jgi:predicted metal-dependent TIM-barrel fold hydrolase
MDIYVMIYIQNIAFSTQVYYYLNMDNMSDKIQTEIMEAMLEYLEGKRSLRSVIVVGINGYHKMPKTEKEVLYEVLSELNIMGNQIANDEDKKYSREEVNEIFTTMLEKLTKD